jgi:hypothetical protein
MGELNFEVLVPKIDAILARGLSHGLGTQGAQVCVEAAICEAMGLPHGDDPGCVAADVREFKIRLNDSPWSSPIARAVGMRDLAIAQLGTGNSLSVGQFAGLVAEKTIRVLIPTLFRDVLSHDVQCMAAADLCEKEGSKEAAAEAAEAAEAANAYAAADAAYAADAADAAANAVYNAAYAATTAADAADAAANAAANASYAAATAAANAVNAVNAVGIGDDQDKYLLLSAKLALDSLIELKAPGVAYL